jgi:hypothetical protein
MALSSLISSHLQFFKINVRCHVLFANINLTDKYRPFIKKMEDGNNGNKRRLKLHPVLDSVRHILKGVEIPCPMCSHSRTVEVNEDHYASCRPQLEECDKCGNRENLVTADTTRIHNIEISRGTSRTLVKMVAKLVESLCLESADTVPEALLHGPNICIVCGCDPCEFQQMEMEILVRGRNHNEDVGLDAGERNSKRRKRAYKYATKHKFGVLGRCVRKKLPSCIEDGVRWLFPTVDGKIMGFLEE